MNGEIEIEESVNPSPQISIITPSLNQAEYIEDTILSVKNQTYDNIEHIVIDGGSTDETLDILNRYDKELDWVSEPDKGQSDAINKGFKKASGEFVGWLNSDDVYFDTKVLERVVNYFDQTEADVIYGDIALIGPNSDILSVHVVPNFDYRQLLRGCFIEQPALFFRDYVLDHNRLDNDLEYVMDYDFWLQLAREYKFYHVNDILAGDRNHPSRKILSQRDKMIREAQEVQRNYGAPSGQRLKLERWLDYLASGGPRTLQAVAHTGHLHRKPPELAFDGRLRPLGEMILNAFTPNRLLVPDPK